MIKRFSFGGSPYFLTVENSKPVFREGYIHTLGALLEWEVGELPKVLYRVPPLP